MDITYLLTLRVAVEQELAIRELFVYKGWPFRKDNDTTDSNFENSKDNSHNGITLKLNTTTSSNESDVCSSNTQNKLPLNVDENQIFSELHDFVQATLEANDDDRFDDNIEEDLKQVIEISYDINKELKLVKKKRESIEGEKCNTADFEKDVKKKDTKVHKKTKKSQKGMFHCKECKCNFKFLGAFNNHKRNGKCLFECKYCGKLFTSRYYSNYLRHLKYHANKRDHKCDVCNKTFVEAHTLKCHMRIHTGERPYVCHYCGKTFHIPQQLTKHKNTTHKESPPQIHKCNICGVLLSTKGNLHMHKRLIHSNDRPFTCEICGKSFKTRKSLEQVHAKVHQDVFPFKCEFPGCGKSFKYKDGLSDHRRRHMNDRTHICEQCGKGFYTNKDLRLHTRTHTGEKPYSCGLCQYKCNLAGNLRKHLKTHKT